MPKDLNQADTLLRRLGYTSLYYLDCEIHLNCKCRHSFSRANCFAPKTWANEEYLVSSEEWLWSLTKIKLSSSALQCHSPPYTWMRWKSYTVLNMQIRFCREIQDNYCWTSVELGHSCHFSCACENSLHVNSLCTGAEIYNCTQYVFVSVRRSPDVIDSIYCMFTKSAPHLHLSDMGFHY